MGTKLHWIDGPWPGKLALAARPRGGDWLADDIVDWQRSGIGKVLSLLTQEEETDLDLGNEEREVNTLGMEFATLPIPDRQPPNSETELAAALERLDADLSAGKKIVVHCRQGVGRAGLVSACLLVTKGLSPQDAVNRVSAARGIAIPETPEQRNWIDHYAAVLPSIG